MNPSELRSTLALCGIFALRMLGLFLILPIFTLYAKNLTHGDNATLVGFTIGVYGMVQACLHIPLGILSDHYGRKRVVACGLVLFVVGALVAASHDDFYWILAGRAIQGAGAISAVVGAWVADLTREEVRARAMALIGASIALSFAVSLVAASPLYAALGMSGMFTLMGVLGGLALLVTLFFLPSVPLLQTPQPNGTQTHWDRFMKVLKDPKLVQLNLGVLVLHASQVAMFIVLPRLMQADGLQVSEHWKMYLSALIISIILMAPMLIRAEKKKQLPILLKAAVIFLLIAQVVFMGLIEINSTNIYLLGLGLVVFFTGFNILESLIPSLISKMSGDNRGAGLGIYNTAMSIGLFLGGFMGGWISGNLGFQAVFLVSLGLLLSWLVAIFKTTNVTNAEKVIAI